MSEHYNMSDIHDNRNKLAATSEYGEVKVHWLRTICIKTVPTILSNLTIQ